MSKKKNYCIASLVFNCTVGDDHSKCRFSLRKDSPTCSFYSEDDLGVGWCSSDAAKKDAAAAKRLEAYKSQKITV